MNKKRSMLKKYSHMAGLAGLVLGMLIFLVPGSAFGQSFEGSEFCQGCHEVNYRDWKASGHPYKLMKSEQARNRPIPLPLGTTWDDVSYVIGGYKWKSRYIDTEGYIITVTEDEDGNPIDGGNQYNYLTGEWVNYHAGEVNKPYDCGTCHTTHWVANPDPTNLEGNQDGLPGMWGTFDVGGVHCEQCHGNGMTMEIDDSAEACGVCHFREAAPGAEVNVIPASGGFVKHHEQYNEHLAGPHANMKCTTCHNPHERGEFSIKEGRDCTDCHETIATSYASNPMGMADYGVECKDCHMPYATKSANQLGPFEGDLQTHLFYINTDPDASMFTADGAYVALDQDGKGAATLDFACIRCHETRDMADLSNFAKNFHGTDTSVSALEYVGLNPGLTGNWWGGPDRNGEGFLLEVAESSGELILVVSFYTYDTAGNQVWLIASGPANTGMTSNVTVSISEGRTWGEDANQSDFTEVFGTAIFDFPACDVGSFVLTPNAKYMGLGYSTIGYDLSRDITASQIACPTMIN
ncbi:MAG: hypothetical protein QNK19_15790 [Xanthomonadales bacterium]|nr:hypothetical protein [Xanthomonadales bacterium]